jgi:hypothetical protein
MPAKAGIHFSPTSFHKYGEAKRLFARHPSESWDGGNVRAMTTGPALLNALGAGTQACTVIKLRSQDPEHICDFSPTPDQLPAASKNRR